MRYKEFMNYDEWQNLAQNLTKSASQHPHTAYAQAHSRNALNFARVANTALIKCAPVNRNGMTSTQARLASLRFELDIKARKLARLQREVDAIRNQIKELE